MKKLISILVFSLLLNSNVYADLYKFFELKEDPKIIIDEIDFDTSLITELNDLEFYLGIGRGNNPVNKSLYELLRNSAAEFEEIQINNDRYFIVSGCRYQSCPEKGFLWIDKKEKIVIGAMIHYFFETKDNRNRDGNLLIMSKQFKNFDDLPPQFNKDLEVWLSKIKVYDFINGKEKNLKPTKKRFVNSNNVIKELEDISKNYIEIVCAPDEEWDSAFKKSKIWFASTKPKYIFHFDEENLRMLKMGISKNVNDTKTINKPVERDKGDYLSFGFYTDANLSAYEDVVNEIQLTDFGGIGSYNRFGLYIVQYRLKPGHTALIGKEIKNPLLSEFKRAREKINSETFATLGSIKMFGGTAGLCENSEIKSYN